MKISIIGSRGIPASYGGFETFAEEISWRLAQNMDVSVVCQASENRKYYFGEAKLRYSKYTKDKNPVKYYLDSLKIALADADIVVVCGVGGSIFYPFLKKKNAKIITHVDGREELRGKYSTLKKLYVLISQSLAAKYSDHIVTDSHAVMKTWKKKYEIPRVKISTIEFGATLFDGNDSYLSEINLLRGEYYLVVCRMVPENNPDMIIKAFVASGSGKKLVLVGDVTGVYGESLLRNASHKIIFLNGIYDKIKLATLRRNSFAYIHGHSVGGTNPSLLESMAAGNVCICHNNEFNRETTDNAMIYFDNASDLSNKIQLVENMSDAEKNDIADKGKVRIETNYNWDSIAKKYIQLFNLLSNDNSEFEITTDRPTLLDSISELAGFLKKEYPYGEIADKKYLAWEYLDNPSGKAIVTTARNEEWKIISQYALSPVLIGEGNEMIPATLSLNTLTSKGYRGKGLFVSTANDAFKLCAANGIAFTYGVPNKNSVHGFKKRLEFTHAGNLVFMAKPVNLVQSIKSLLKSNRKKKGNAIDFNLDTEEMNKNSISELIFPQDEKNYSDFISRWNQLQNISIQRSPQYLNWRYVLNPLRKYRLLKLMDNDMINAILVIRTLHLYGLKVCLIMDHLSLNKTNSAKMLNVISSEAKRNHLDLIIAVAASTKNSQFRQLTASGFRHIPAFLLPQQLPFITRIHNDYDYWKPRLNKLKNWHFSFGDYDVF